MSYIEAQGPHLFLDTIWKPFEARTQSIETKFINHATTVLRFAGAQQLIPFYKAFATGDQSLNPRSSEVSVPMKNEAFQKAIQNYIDKISNDDKEAFQSATDAMNKLGSLPPSKSHISISVMQKLKKLQQYVKQFLGSIAICIQQTLQISSLVLGGLNCILRVCTTSFHNTYYI